MVHCPVLYRPRRRAIAGIIWADGLQKKRIPVEIGGLGLAEGSAFAMRRESIPSGRVPEVSGR